MNHIGLIAKFRRNDLIAALERAPQQVRPKGLYRLSKDDLQAELLRAMNRLPDVAEMVAKMATKIDNPYRIPERYLAAARTADVSD
jgi:hypothetical protein